MSQKDKMTADRLRAEIDRGAAGDKIPFSDPAAAPLGTDDEAAGTPPTPEQLEHARRAELAGRADADLPRGKMRAENNRTIGQRQGPLLSGPLIMVGLGAVVVVILALLFL
ncbi:hypothetical protein ACFQXB_11110 [Plastorhodobacter daqingensis]|uniref:Uncharacterized protein n=1 Tax=Plastorhodobacter daqingensis TaxID=1387281 RepID=A0ABW2UJ61_9RHOB